MSLKFGVEMITAVNNLTVQLQSDCLHVVVSCSSLGSLWWNVWYQSILLKSWDVSCIKHMKYDLGDKLPASNMQTVLSKITQSLASTDYPCNISILWKIIFLPCCGSKHTCVTKLVMNAGVTWKVFNKRSLDQILGTFDRRAKSNWILSDET